VSGRVTKRDSAKRDLLAQFVYLGRHNLDVAHRFLDAAERAFAQIADMPGLGSPWESDNPRLANVRVWPIRGFENSLIFYRPVTDGIEVLHVFHGAQDIEMHLEK
jgi:toxin ParE1/3/4